MARLRATPEGTSRRSTAYDDGGLLLAVEADVRGETPATTFVESIEYDVHGRRARLELGNGTETTYEYDAVTFRLRRVHTTRDTDDLQDLRYTHDPVGNVVELQDFALQTVYFQNAEVEPHQSFRYDAIYRLVTATGREHTSQGQPIHSEMTPGPQPEPNDPSALRAYTEEYTYDEVGNLTELHHAWSGSSWTRAHDYDDDGNRLLASSLPGDTIGSPETYSATYDYDAHGNMTAMPHLEAIDWDHADRMQHADLNGGGDVYFQYDAEGNRVRKIRINQNGTAANERIYLGGFELYRERDVDVGELSDIDLERETLHIVDDTGRIVMVETLTIDEGDPVTSAANIVCYEEYHPFGTSAYRAVDSTIEVSPKRYRYAAAERDEETGLDHMGLRYYAPWLGRWTSADPIGLGDGVNRYAYVHGNPVSMRDPSGTQGEDFDVEAARARIAEIDQRLAELDKLDALKADVAEFGRKLGTLEAETKSVRRKVERARAEEPASGVTAGDVASAVTAPHRFVAGQAVGAAEASADIALALPRLGIGLYQDPAAVGEAISGRFAEHGVLGATPVPELVENVKGIFTAESAFEAGRSHGKASVSTGETVSLGAAAVGIGRGVARLAGRTASAEAAATSTTPQINLDTGSAIGFVSEGSPVRGTLKAAAQGRQMVMTETAVGEFQGTLRVAGPKETARAGRLLDRVQVVADDPSARAMGLTVTKSVGAADKVIFGTADKLRIPTMTPDAKFLRGAAEQGVQFEAILHRPIPFTGR